MEGVEETGIKEACMWASKSMNTRAGDRPRVGIITATIMMALMPTNTYTALTMYLARF